MKISYCIDSFIPRRVLRAGIATGLAALLAGALGAAPPGTLPFGIYDPNGEFSDDPEVQIEHLFLPWEDVFLQSLDLADDYAQARGRSVLVTVEPWSWSRAERNYPDVLRQGIGDGSYDDNMRAICVQLAAFDSPVTVRWAQEMDDTTSQFIWAGWELAGLHLRLSPCGQYLPRGIGRYSVHVVAPWRRGHGGVLSRR